MKLLKFTHSNNNVVMYLVAEKICGFYFSKAHEATFIVGDGQTVFPAKESVEEIKKILESSVNTETASNIVPFKPKGE